MLENELTRKPADMDTQLVAELMLTFEPDGPDAALLERTWERIASGLPAAQRKRKALQVLGWLGKTAACILVVLVFLFAVFGMAKAFGEKPLKPGVVQDGENHHILHTTAAAEFPDICNGYRVEPAWMPDRFSFAQGALYENDNVTKATVIYHSDLGEFIVTMTFCADSETIPQYAYEKKPNDNSAWRINGCVVNRYMNSDSDVLSTSWLFGDAHYFTGGMVTDEEMIQIVESLIQ